MRITHKGRRAVEHKDFARIIGLMADVLCIRMAQQNEQEAMRDFLNGQRDILRLIARTMCSAHAGMPDAVVDKFITENRRHLERIWKDALRVSSTLQAQDAQKAA